MNAMCLPLCGGRLASVVDSSHWLCVFLSFPVSLESITVLSTPSQRCRLNALPLQTAASDLRGSVVLRELSSDNFIPVKVLGDMRAG